MLLYQRARPEGPAFWKVCIIVILCIIMFCLCVWMEFVGLTWVHKDSVAYEEHFQIWMNLTELDHADVTLCSGLSVQIQLGTVFPLRYRDDCLSFMVLA